jgi:O-antigen ligase
MFLAMMAFIPFGLFVESHSPAAKLFFLAETLLILTGLLFTYSASAWIGVGVAIVVFVLFVGDNRYRFQIPMFLLIAAAVLLIWFPSQVNLLLQHASDPAELRLRNAVWQTALRVIAAYPLTGVGLGHQAYLERADPFRAVGQVLPYDHPHNSYLEWGAMAGLPVLFIFLMLLACILWQAVRNWMIADARARSLLGVGIASIIVLCFTSWSNQGWTLPPLAACGWIILGVISSPILRKSLIKGEEQIEKTVQA